jgi:hypothetical protein
MLGKRPIAGAAIAGLRSNGATVNSLPGEFALAGPNAVLRTIERLSTGAFSCYAIAAPALLSVAWIAEPSPSAIGVWTVEPPVYPTA